ncbi:MAG: TonB-dependent receptor [Gammaproteobacteria bacterium]|nr:TonB-dependent receptor [Gammaproteobacteria bacterium]
MNFSLSKRALMLYAIVIALPITTLAQEDVSQAPEIESPVAMAGGVIEEQVVLGRFIGSAQALLLERQEDESIVDTIDAESISRTGDSTVAAALRRVTGLTLVNDKFIYVRGLGERYSTTTLNGASIPSPDLSRNVLPLNLFPASIVSSLSVQKTFSADIAANFAGGLVDIRTTPFPDGGFNFSAELGSGKNLRTGNKVYTYTGGDNDRLGTDDGTRDLSIDILASLATYRGNLSSAAILQSLQKSSPDTATAALASQVNTALISSLNRDVSVREKSSSPDLSGKFSLGNTYDFSDDIVAGFQISAGYDNEWRERESKTFDASFPDERFAKLDESTFSVSLTGTATFGLRIFDEHDLTFTSLFLRNTDDETSIRDGFDADSEKSGGSGNRIYGIKFEERELTVNQIRGEHVMGYSTKEWVPANLLDWLPEESKLTWFWSESTAATVIPNEVSGAYITNTDPVTGAVLSSTLSLDTSAVDFRFTDLSDDVSSYGWTSTIPVSFQDAELAVRFGYSHDRKSRVYAQREFGVGPQSVGSTAILTGGIAEVLSDSNLADSANDFVFNVQGSGTRSYLAATMTDANFAMLDFTWKENVTLSLGVRDEYYRQVALPWNILGYTLDQPQINPSVEYLESYAFEDDGVFPAASLVYRSEWLAKTFQLRFGASETAIRPDLREVMDASYLDPLTGELVFGNTSVRPASSLNLDIRADWFFANGNSFTVSAFSKNIDDPIEFFEVASSDTNTAREIINAESTKIRGVELDGLMELGSLGAWGETLFVKANLTVQDSETVAGANADAPTNNVRPASGASDYIMNFMLGYDSVSGIHAASIVYNIFGERLYVAGRNESFDLYEQPFQSLDVTYTWYPAEQFVVKLKVQNLLDEHIEITRADVPVFSEKPGMALAASVKYDF